VVKKIAGELEIENSSIPQQRSVAGGFFYWLDGKKHGLFIRHICLAC